MFVNNIHKANKSTNCILCLHQKRDDSLAQNTNTEYRDGTGDNHWDNAGNLCGEEFGSLGLPLFKRNLTAILFVLFAFEALGCHEHDTENAKGPHQGAEGSNRTPNSQNRW